MSTINRREFIAANAAVAASLFLESAGAQRQDAPGLRTITYNVRGFQGFPMTRSNLLRLKAARSQFPERIAIELGLYRPDIVTLQECASHDFVVRIAGALKMGYAFFPGGWRGNVDFPGGFPGAILTRYPIVSSQNCPLADGGGRPSDLFTRHWGMAILDTPGGLLPVFSAHLHPDDSTVRAREVKEAIRVMKQQLTEDGSLLFQGDLNHTPDDPEYPQWTSKGFADTSARKGRGPKFTFPSPKPQNRIDYIWAAGKLVRQLQSCRILWEGAFRTNPDDFSSFALSDHVPVLSVFG